MTALCPTSLARPRASRVPAQPSVSKTARAGVRRVPIDGGVHLSDATHARPPRGQLTAPLSPLPHDSRRSLKLQ
jgi:hypothetical protein